MEETHLELLLACHRSLAKGMMLHHRTMIFSERYFMPSPSSLYHQALSFLNNKTGEDFNAIASEMMMFKAEGLGSSRSIYDFASSQHMRFRVSCPAFLGVYF